MYRQMPMWFSKRVSLFDDIGSNAALDISRIPATGNSPSCLKLTQKVRSAETATPWKFACYFARKKFLSSKILIDSSSHWTIISQKVYASFIKNQMHIY